MSTITNPAMEELMETMFDEDQKEILEKLRALNKKCSTTLTEIRKSSIKKASSRLDKTTVKSS